MNVSAAPCSPRLAPFVSGLGCYQSALPAGQDRVLPNGTMTVMVNLAEDEFRTYSGPGGQTVHRAVGAMLSGPDPRAVMIDTAEQRHGLSVSFAFGGAAPFFPLPFGALTGQLISLDALWGRDGAVLRERLLETAGPRRQFAVLEEVLLAHLADDRTGRPGDGPAIGYATAELARGRRVRDVAEDVGLLPRTFTRRFRDRTGLTPKRFARIQRLQRAAAAVAAGHGADGGAGHRAGYTDWAQVAADHGYCDQAHLIDDFRDLAGITPGAYRPRSAEEHNHLPVP